MHGPGHWSTCRLAVLLAIIGDLVPGTAILLVVGGMAGAKLVTSFTVLSWAFGGAITGFWGFFGLLRAIVPIVPT
jgi:hypothetical protein